MKALVVFTDGDRADPHPLSRFLKPGFRHVFCCVVDGDYWLMVEPGAGVPTLKVMAHSKFDLAQFWRDEGHTVIETEQRKIPSRHLFTWNNCVGMVKAVLCLPTWALTPYQLYRSMVRVLPGHASAKKAGVAMVAEKVREKQGQPPLPPEAPPAVPAPAEAATQAVEEFRVPRFGSEITRPAKPKRQTSGADRGALLVDGERAARRTMATLGG